MYFIGILIRAYYNPYITGKYNPLYTANNQGFGHCSSGQMEYNISPTRFPWNKGISLPKHYLLGAQAVWGRYNLTKQNACINVDVFKYE